MGAERAARTPTCRSGRLAGAGQLVYDRRGTERWRLGYARQAQRSAEAFLMPWMDRAYSALLRICPIAGCWMKRWCVWAGRIRTHAEIQCQWPVVITGDSVSRSPGWRRYSWRSCSRQVRWARSVSGQRTGRTARSACDHVSLSRPFAETELLDTEGRPIPISRGRVIEEIL